MSLLKWKPAYTIGIPAIDFEHRELIGMINQLYADMGAAPEAWQIESALGEIHATISAHFALEEHQMKKANYPEYEDHKANHEELLDDLRELMDIFDSDPVLGHDLLEQRLSSWFSVHFASFDARLHHNLH